MRDDKMEKEFMNGSLKKIALLSIFLIFIVGTASAQECDLYVDSVEPDYYYSSIISAWENNSIEVIVGNAGPNPALYVDVYLYASDQGVSPVASTTIDFIEVNRTETVVLVDETVREEEGQMTYNVEVSSEYSTDPIISNNTEPSGTIDVKYNGYKGKWPYWPGKDNITTKQMLTCNRTMIYYNQTPEKYAPSKWTTRTETWTGENLPVPPWATVNKAQLYISYNWDNTTTENPDAPPDFTATFNGDSITLGTPYTDKSNFGTYGVREYGLYSVDVTSYYNKATDNELVMTPNPATGYTQALYPSTLVVVYSDLNETWTNVYINEEADYLYPRSTYGVTEDEAIAYIPFYDICTCPSVQKAELYSFAANAGHPSAGITHEGNLYFNDLVVTDLWHGDSRSAYPEIVDVTAYLQKDNLARIQGTLDGKGMLAIEQILVVKYNGCCC